MGVVFRRLAGIKASGKIPRFSATLFKQIVVIAVPSTLQQSFISVGNIILQGVINGFGPGVMAGYSAAVKLNNLVITSFTTIGNGISNFTAQNIGAGMFARIKSGFRAGVRMVWIICIPLVIVYFFASEFLIKLFVDEPSEMALISGANFLRIVPPFYFVISVKLVADGILRGAGLMKQFMAATFTDLILRVGLALLLSEPFGYIGIWCSWPVGWAVATILSLLFYGREPWKKQNVVR